MADVRAAAAARDGIDGLDGATAYELALQNGFVGSEVEWLASLVGPKGEKGDPGLDGQDGRSVDVAEVKALVDAAVAEIPPAKDGADGRDGIDGKDGRDGKDATLPKQVPYVATFHRAGDITTGLLIEPETGKGRSWLITPTKRDERQRIVEARLAPMS